MKNLLLATTALVATTLAASAEVKIGGYGRFALSYADNGVLGNSDTIIDTRLRMNIDASTETDSGVTFGGRIRLQYDESDDTENMLSPAQIYAEMGGMRLEVGNVNTAYDSAGLLYASEIGILDRSFGDSSADFFSFASDEYENDDQMGIFFSYTVGDLIARVSYVDYDQTDSFYDPEIGVSADYKFGPVSVSAAFVQSSTGDSEPGAEVEDLYFLGAEYAVTDVANVGVLYYDEGDYGYGAADTTLTLYGNYTIGATTVSAYVAQADGSGLASDTAYGIGGKYDIGGAYIAGAIHSNYDEDIIGDVGVRFSF